jgi:hypothetical protein
VQRICRWPAVLTSVLVCDGVHAFPYIFMNDQ